jgi:hypothetical protein
MAAIYNNKSPWYKTKIFPGYLGHLNIRPVAAEPDDFLYTIEPQFNYRPDLLAFALYGDRNLWWVFSQRNLDIIEDPIFDFRSGVQIYVPKKTGLISVLGI